MNRAKLTAITDVDFDQLTFDSTSPVLVFFGTKRCKICKEQLPIVEQLAFEFAGKMHIYWVDVEKHKPLFQRFRLRGIPNQLLFNNGEVKERISGLYPKDALIQIIEKVINK